MLARCWPDVGQMLGRSTGTEKYSFTVPPGRRKAIGKPCIKYPISLNIPYGEGMLLEILAMFLGGFGKVLGVF